MPRQQGAAGGHQEALRRRGAQARRGVVQVLQGHPELEGEHRVLPGEGRGRDEDTDVRSVLSVA